MGIGRTTNRAKQRQRQAEEDYARERQKAIDRAMARAQSRNTDGTQPDVPAAPDGAVDYAGRFIPDLPGPGVFDPETNLVACCGREDFSLAGYRVHAGMKHPDG